MARFADINVSHIATYARCSGFFNIHLTTDLPRNLWNFLFGSDLTELWLWVCGHTFLAHPVIYCLCQFRSGLCSRQYVSRQICDTKVGSDFDLARRFLLAVFRAQGRVSHFIIRPRLSCAKSHLLTRCHQGQIYVCGSQSGGVLVWLSVWSKVQTTLWSTHKLYDLHAIFYSWLSVSKSIFMFP